MSGIRSYDLSNDQVQSLFTALSGNEEERTKWLNELGEWLNYRNRKMEILRWAEEWFKLHAVKTGAHLEHDDYLTEDERLIDWVCYQMEYVHGLCWDDASDQVIVNYAISLPLVSGYNLVDLLEYITLKIKEGMSIKSKEI